jgi:hypothetical protein
LHRIYLALAPLLVCVVLGSVPAHAHEDRDATLTRLDEAIATAPDDPELWRSRAVLERRRGGFAQAHADLSKAVDLGLDRTLAQRDRGLIWLDERRFGDAEASLRSARTQSPQDAPTILAHARSLAGLERWREAADSYTALVALAPASSPDVQLERIHAAEMAGGPAGMTDALRVTETALAALGSIPALEQAALDLEMRAGRVDAALARLDRLAGSGVLARDTVLLRRAEILERAGRQQAARAAYADALAALDARTQMRRATPAARQLESQAREGIARLAKGDDQ